MDVIILILLSSSKSGCFFLFFFSIITNNKFVHSRIFGVVLKSWLDYQGINLAKQLTLLAH